MADGYLGIRLASSGRVETVDVSLPYNKQLQQTVTRHCGDAARAPFHYALASRRIRLRHLAAPLIASVMRQGSLVLHR